MITKEQVVNPDTVAPVIPIPMTQYLFISYVRSQKSLAAQMNAAKESLRLIEEFRTRGVDGAKKLAHKREFPSLEQVGNCSEHEIDNIVKELETYI